MSAGMWPALAASLSTVADADTGRGLHDRAVRAHVEHPFAHQNRITRLVIRTIGVVRASAAVTLAKHGLQYEALALARRAIYPHMIRNRTKQPQPQPQPKPLRQSLLNSAFPGDRAAQTNIRRPMGAGQHGFRRRPGYA